jgi:hypothetical protein
MPNSYAFIPMDDPNSPDGETVRVDAAVANCGHRIEGIAFILAPYTNPALRIEKGLGFAAITAIISEWHTLQDRELQTALAAQQQDLEALKAKLAGGRDANV